MAARIALLRAQRQLYSEAGVYITLRNFNVCLPISQDGRDGRVSTQILHKRCDR